MCSLPWFECKSPGRLTGRPVSPPPLRELLEASILKCGVFGLQPCHIPNAEKPSSPSLGSPVPRVHFQFRSILREVRSQAPEWTDSLQTHLVRVTVKI